MPMTPNAEIKIGGSPIAEELKARRSRIEVEDHLILPDTFALYFHDPRHSIHDDRQRGSGSFLQQNGVQIGAEVAISAAASDEDQKELLIEGEVTCIEACYDEVNSYLVVRGYDKSHRMHRGKKTQAHVQKRDGDLVGEAARAAGIADGQVDDPGTQVEHFARLNLTDWELLQARAKATGREVLMRDGKLHFRKPTSASSAPSPAAPAGTDPLVLKFPDTLLSFNPRLTAPQYGKVEVRGWDPAKKEPIKPNPVDITSKSASLNDQPTQLAHVFGDSVFFQPTPFSVPAEVSDMAAALAEQIGSTFAEADGVSRGHPKLKAGTAVTVEGVSEEFKGKWTISGSRHVLSWDQAADEPYVTHLDMSGRQDRSLLGLTSGVSTNSPVGSDPRIYGVVIGLVVNTEDPIKLGRVKVKYPWLPDPNESDWARVLQPGAGKKRGMIATPEVDDEVLVAFEHGDQRRPYVIGNLYNGKDKPSSAEADPLTREGGKAAVEGYVSRSGSRLIFHDKGGDEYVLLRTGPDSGNPKVLLKLDKKNTTIELTSDGEIKIKAGAKPITVQGDAKITIEAKQDVEVKAGTSMKLEATASLELKAAAVKIEGTGPVEVKGAVVKLN